MATILIVDDQAASREQLAALLGEQGHRLLQAEDGTNALALARAERPDAVIAGGNAQDRPRLPQRDDAGCKA